MTDMRLLPVTYVPNFVENPDEALTQLQTLDWESREDAPRLEYYCNDFPGPYVYGKGAGRRTYLPRPWHPAITAIRTKLEAFTEMAFEVCFLNRYLNQSHHLGWHADDSPEMDDERHIVTISLGVEREIWFRRAIGRRCSCCGMEPGSEFSHKMSCYVRDSYKTNYGEVQKLKLAHGSLCLMHPGMQDVWQHRIPKAGFKCGERISLTFRGYVQGGPHV